MRNISDVMEAHLKQIIEKSKYKTVEIKRSQIVEKFSCVSSQINYVIITRFTPEHRYHVESKRGGGGYIRIQKMAINNKNTFINELIDIVRPEADQRLSIAVIEQSLEEDSITKTESKLMISTN